jgi:fructose transport system ATP-binding protein
MSDAVAIMTGAMQPPPIEEQQLTPKSAAKAA